MTANIKKHRFILASLLLLLVLLAGACGISETPTATPAPTATPEPTPTDTPQPEAPAEIASPPAETTTRQGSGKPALPDDDSRPLADLPMPERVNLYAEPPDLIIDPETIYVATIKTNKGDIMVELYAREAPQSVNNFVVLSTLGYYDGLAWGFTPQAPVLLSGDPLATGQGGPGYSLPQEHGVPLLEGAVGALPDPLDPQQANSGSQFYLTLAPIPELTGILTVFGQIVEGMDIATKLVPNDIIESIAIEETTVRRAPTPPPTPEPVAPVIDPEGGRPLADMDPVQRNGIFNTPPAMQLEPDTDYRARIVTEKGDIVVDLFEDQVPNTVNNFVVLASLGFYDNTTFHRVIEEFMAQAGDPTGTGSGGPGYRFADEFVPELKHDAAGTLSMANAGPGTNGSQFFLTFVPTPWLDGRHTIFGKVIEGLDVLESISLRDPQTATEPGDLIKRIDIETQ